MSTQEPAPAGSSVWLAIVHHRHGQDWAVCASQEGAWLAIREYVAAESDDVDYTECLPNEADVARYFEGTQGDEWYEIEEGTVGP